MVLVAAISSLPILLVSCKLALWKCKAARELYSEWYKMLPFQLVQLLAQLA